MSARSERRFGGARDSGPILRVQMLFPPVDPGSEMLQLVAEEIVDRLAAVDEAGRQIPIPDEVVGSLGGQAETFLDRLDQLFPELAFVDVPEPHGKAAWARVGIDFML